MRLRGLGMYTIDVVMRVWRRPDKSCTSGAGPKKDHATFAGPRPSSGHGPNKQWQPWRINIWKPKVVPTADWQRQSRRKLRARCDWPTDLVSLKRRCRYLFSTRFRVPATRTSHADKFALSFQWPCQPCVFARWRRPECRARCNCTPTGRNSQTRRDSRKGMGAWA